MMDTQQGVQVGIRLLLPRPGVVLAWGRGEAQGGFSRQCLWGSYFGKDRILHLVRYLQEGCWGASPAYKFLSYEHPDTWGSHFLDAWRHHGNINKEPELWS